MEQAHATVIADDAHLRVTSWEFGPHTSTGPHRHEFGYVVVPVSGGTFTVVAPDGSTTDMTQQPGGAYVRSAGVEHEVVNGGDRPAVFVEVEIKQAREPRGVLD